ncbi:MAG: Asp23/Gls24 family envelope stress response protein [Candidatus Omnitrophica bacterium]|nr:Asp23/Gls24 family envelope stress response protein [Candidatus Omnitrophota bacterium]
MPREEARTDQGIIRIHDNAIASITRAAAIEVEGVKSIGKNLTAGLMELFDKKTMAAIKVGKDKSGEITVSIPLIIKYGFNIPDVAGKVQENVRNALEKMTSLAIKDINVNVQAVERG